MKDGMISNERILLVDDEIELLEGLKRHFEVEGLKVETCSSAESALKLVQEKNFNIIMTDIKMPGMDGVELLRAIKDMNPLCNVMIMTAYSNMSYLLDCFSAGACDYFAKPFQDMDEVIDALKTAIERVTRWKKGMGFGGFKGTP